MHYPIDAANLTVADQDFDNLESTLGLSVSKQYVSATGVSYVPEAHIAYMHEFMDEKQASTSTFAAGGPSFSTSGLDPADDSLNVGASLAIYANESIDVRAAYDFQYKDDYDSHSGQMVVRFKFY